MLIRSLLLLSLALGCAAAQSFEVASIKPNSSGDNRMMNRIEPGGRYSATGITAKFLIGMAYDVRDFQIVNGPGWLGAERFDINAKAPESAGADVTIVKLRPMIRALLEERFQFKAHTETREMGVYTLVPGKSGPKLTPSAAGQGQGERAGMMRIGRGRLDCQGIPVAMLARQLSQLLGRPVIDKTGLTGNFDVTLEWSPDPGMGGPGGPGGGPPPADAMPAAGSSGPSLFTAVQEQLGLRLESAKGPVETVVIDRVERPSEN